jgi:hypothetical protein
MSNVSSNDRVSHLDRIFLVSVVLGPAASYSILYLFHLVLGLKLGRTTVAVFAGRPFVIPHGVRWDIVFLAFFLGWYALSIMWAQNIAYALRYCAYVGLAVLAILYVMRICDTQARLRTVLRVLAVIILLQIGISVLEGAGLIRLPTSPYSPYQVFFGRHPSDLNQFASHQVEYIQRLPTGFFGNPNNLAAFLILILPFFIMLRNPLAKILGAAAIFYVIYMAGARASLIAYAFVILAAIIFYAANTRHGRRAYHQCNAAKRYSAGRPGRVDGSRCDRYGWRPAEWRRRCGRWIIGARARAAYAQRSGGITGFLLAWRGRGRKRDGAGAFIEPAWPSHIDAQFLA